MKISRIFLVMLTWFSPVRFLMSCWVIVEPPALSVPVMRP